MEFSKDELLLIYFSLQKLIDQCKIDCNGKINNWANKYVLLAEKIRENFHEKN